MPNYTLSKSALKWPPDLQCEARDPVLGAINKAGKRALRGKAKPGLCVGSNPTLARVENRGCKYPDRSHWKTEK